MDNSTVLQILNFQGFYEYTDVDNMILDYKIMNRSEFWLGLAYCFGCGLPVLYDTTAHCLLLPLFQNIRLKFGTEVALVIPQAELIFGSHYVCKLMRLISCSLPYSSFFSAFWQLKNLSAMEVNIVRPFMVRTLQAFYKHDSPQMIQQADNTGSRSTPVTDRGPRVSPLFCRHDFYCVLGSSCC
jgi:hypothetical protein